MDVYPPKFEETDHLRSAFIRELTLHLLDRPNLPDTVARQGAKTMPRTLVQYWHDPNNLPDDVRACLASWDRLADEGFNFQMFSDASAQAYIAERYGVRENEAFARCRHPAMRSDYLRMCFVLYEGGFYVDADDVLLSDGWKELFKDSRLKLQPLCYDIPTARMVPATDIWRADLPTDGRIFYVNNNPIAAPADHPILQAALSRATDRLLGEDPLPEIQSTTGPGNLTAALAAHAHNLIRLGAPLDFELLHSWETIAETRWHLSYRDDERNWRNMDAG
jgi:mannosyltransferase OCH1-like enzyme